MFANTHRPIGGQLGCYLYVSGGTGAMTTQLRFQNKHSKRSIKKTTGHHAMPSSIGFFLKIRDFSELGKKDPTKLFLIAGKN